jgi:hypothetical protein
MEFKGEVFNEAHKYKQGNTDTRGLKAVAVFRCLKCHAMFTLHVHVYFDCVTSSF